MPGRFSRAGPERTERAPRQRPSSRLGRRPAGIRNTTASLTEIRERRVAAVSMSTRLLDDSRWRRVRAGRPWRIGPSRFRRPRRIRWWVRLVRSGEPGWRKTCVRVTPWLTHAAETSVGPAAAETVTSSLGQQSSSEAAGMMRRRRGWAGLQPVRSFRQGRKDVEQWVGAGQSQWHRFHRAV